jgi:hypothetical protein
MDLKGTAQLSLSHPDGSSLPPGLSFAFEPGQLSVPTGTEVQATLRLAASTSVTVSEYAFVVTVASEGKEASIPVLVRIAGIGPQWARQIGTSGTDTLVAMVTDSQGNLYAAINSTGSLDGKTNQGDYDGYLLAYSSSGFLRWTAQIASSKTDFLSGLAIDADDTAVVIRLHLRNLAGTSLAGPHRWLRRALCTEWPAPVAQAAGHARDRQAQRPQRHSAGHRHRRSVAPKAAMAWAKMPDSAMYGSFGSGPMAQSYRRCSSEAIKPTLPMQLPSTAIKSRMSSVPRGGVLPTGSSLGLQDAFALSLGADGKLGWVRHVGSSGTDELATATTDGSGGIWAAGYTKGTLAGQVSMGGQDCMLLRFAADGSRTVNRQIGTATSTASSRWPGSAASSTASAALEARSRVKMPEAALTTSSVAMGRRQPRVGQPGRHRPSRQRRRHHRPRQPALRRCHHLRRLRWPLTTRRQRWLHPSPAHLLAAIWTRRIFSLASKTSSR